LEFNNELLFPLDLPSPKVAKAATDKPIKKRVASFLVNTSLNIFW